MSNEVTINLNDKRVRMLGRLQVLQDAWCAFALVPAGLARIHSADLLERSLAVVELLAVTALVLVTVRELRGGDDDVSEVSWTNFAVGAVLIVESALQTHEHGHWFRPTLLTGVASIILGYVQNQRRKKGKRRRMIRVSDERLVMHLGKFRKFDQPWSEIERVEDTGDTLIISPRSGRKRKIQFKRYDNAEEIRSAIMGRAEERNVTLIRG